MRREHAKVALLVLAAGLAGPARAETIVSQRIKATHRLIPLTKITVGPDDQYNAAPDPSGKTLIFTHKSDLVPHLCRQNLSTGDVTDLLPLTADSQESTVGPDGRVAFTYYKFNARGDICYSAIPADASHPVDDGGITCLKAGPGEAQSERSNPFWRGPHELGYVVRDITTQGSQIVSEDLLTGARQVLAQGKVWSPAMKTGGRYLFFSEMTDSKDNANRVLKVKDLVSGRVRSVHFALPGISGFPAVSEDERYLYFSHYLDDTNGDGVIDGSDNSVVFRAPVLALLATPEDGEYFPEQLTSVENNCSFPHPFGANVYVSCAFEGSLDVYEMAASGVVPADWTAEVLANAHQTARTYAERILLLNTMKFREHVGGRELDERLLSDHVLADDITASKFYVASLQKEATPELQDFYALLRLYLKARERKKAQPSAEVSRDFLSQIQTLDAQVQAVKGQARFRSIVRGMLASFVNEPRQAQGFLRQVKWDRPGLPLERYLSFELAAWVLPRTEKPRTDDGVIDSLLAAYRQMAGAPELTEETQIYYAFNLLAYLQQAGDPKDPKALSERVSRINSVNHGLPTPVDQLLQSEVATLTIIQAPDDTAKTKAYSPLDKLMSASRADYYLRKALYVRSILNFAEAQEFKFMDYVATNWLRYTASSDTEFIHAREFYAQAELDHAYAAWGQKNYQLAGSYFYGSLSLTDDLESHSGYVRMTIRRGARATVDERYKNLASRQFIDDNLKFVDALLLLIDQDGALQKDTGLTKPYDQAIEMLNAMVQDRDSPVRYLLLGYCYLEKLLRTGVGYEIDTDLLQNAHRALMLAYDLGRDNARIKASALSDLGILHQRAQNHGLAAKFFSLRKPLGFVSSDEAAGFAWLYARSLYYTHDPERAADELANAPGNVGKEFVGPLTEREAFYRTGAGQYDQAASLYSKLLESGYVQGDASLAKVNLAYGWCLFKLKKGPEAQRALQTALAHSEKLGHVSKSTTRLIDFDPVRIRLAAYGLLGQTGSDAERLDALEKRSALLSDAKKLFDETSYLPDVIENDLQLTALATRVQPAAASAHAREALAHAEQLGDSELGYLSNAVYHGAVEYMAHAWLHPELYGQENPDRLRKVVDRCMQAYDKQHGVQPLLAYQKLKLQLLWAGYSSRVLKTGAPDAVRGLMASDAAAQVRSALPKQGKELDALAVALAR